MAARRSVWRATAGTAGLLGSALCASSMTLVSVGIGVSSAATGMAAMSGATGTHPGLLGLLLRAGPGLLVASVLLISSAFALKRPLAAGPALITGAVLYWGMFRQQRLTVMYLTIALGYTVWAALFLWARSSGRRRAIRRLDPTETRAAAGANGASR
jgi:hypothetical protein